MSPVDLTLWALVVILGLGAAWLSRPRPPHMDWERLLKLGVLTQLRGEVEARDGDAEEWLRLGRLAVWYHPAARDLVVKLEDPAAHELPVPALPGERALLEALRAAPDLPQRVDRVFGDSAGGDEALYDDPALLGPEWDLQALLGPGAGWEDVAQWSESLQKVLARRSEHLTWVLVSESPEREELQALAAGLGEAVGADSVRLLPLGEPAALIEALTELLPTLSDRVVLLGEGEGAAALARALAEAPGLRDRVRAVFAIGGRLGGETADFLAERFTHEGMDTEISRAVPWFHLGFLDPAASPPGVEGLPLKDTAWPAPPEPDSGRAAIEVIDLGVFPLGLPDARPRLLGRALALLTLVRLALE
ncbi:MAG: hypothetical protein H6741_07385 [Alphaproteobacteria bacterium]|nr:hypothetical protein [Alphaproteobacteria bacterium]